MNTCEICGMAKGYQSIVMCGKEIKFPFYQCDCMDVIRKKQEEIEREAHKKRVLLERIKESRLPKISIQNRFLIPAKSVYKDDEDTKEPIEKKDYEKVHRYMLNIQSNIRKGVGLFMPGNLGTGKTIILGELGKLAIEAGFEVKYFTASKIVNEKIDIVRHRFTDVVIIDDLGMAKIEVRDNKLFEFINDRIDNRKATWIASNSTEEQMKEHVGEALVDRLKMFYICFMIGESRREFKENNVL